jgi:hypothetical protein
LPVLKIAVELLKMEATAGSKLWRLGLKEDQAKKFESSSFTEVELPEGYFKRGVVQVLNAS